MSEEKIANVKKDENGMLKKIFRFLKGMPFSFILLGIIIGACVLGSVIPQGRSVSFYMESYGATRGGLIIGLLLDRVFQSWWFLLLAGLLCFNLILCSLSRIKSVYGAWKRTGVFGIWGSWVTHLGILLLIVSFVLGQMSSKEAEVYGIAGSTQALGRTGLTVSIDSFEVRLRDDYTVEQYVAGLTISNDKGESVSGEASVNHPLKAFGYSFYQDSMGWASYVDIYKDEEKTGTDLICAGEYTYPEDLPSLVLMLGKFYPDFATGEDGSFYSMTPLPNNPRMLYSIYYNGSIIQMDLAKPGEYIPVHNYGFVMYDPTEYTLIVAKSDPYSGLVLASAVIVLLGLFMSLYLRPWEEKRRKENG